MAFTVLEFFHLFENLAGFSVENTLEDNVLMQTVLHIWV